MTGFSIGQAPISARDLDGLRPVCLRHDLGPLADLIELVFADNMDSAGRAAIREMRYLSHMGLLLGPISRLNDLAMGISLGFVYVMDGALVGNVSVYPASYPRALGATWILANVAVHPRYRGRGIAGRLVDAGLEMIRQRGGARVILQVNYDNEAALRLYARRGFIYERAWRAWRRSGFLPAPMTEGRRFRIVRPRANEWQAELKLAQAARPNALGGVGWLKPVHEGDFRRPVWRRLRDLLAMNGKDKLIIRDEATDEILAACWLEGGLGFGSLRAWLYAAPQIDSQPYLDALLANLVSRHERAAIVVEHPLDDETMSQLLKERQFKVQRELWHMRLDL